MIDARSLRETQFPVAGRCAYLDHATFGPPSQACVDAATSCFRGLAGVGPAGSPWSEETERVRVTAAGMLGCRPADLAFLKSTAEAMGLVALGLDWQPGDEVIAYERGFPAGVLPWLNLAHLGVRLRLLRDGGRHRWDVADLAELIGERTRVVSLELASFGNGFRAPVAEVAKLCRERGVWLLVDATQAAGALAVDVERLGCHLLAAHGYKFLASGYGTAPTYVAPELSARLRVPEPGWKSRAVFGGSSTEYDRVEFAEEARRYEPSIPDLTSIVALGAAMELWLGLGPAAVEERVLDLSARSAAWLREHGFRVVSSPADGEVSAIVSFEREGVAPEALQAELAEAGVVTAVREGRVRLSFHCYNDDGDLDRLFTALERLGRA